MATDLQSLKAGFAEVLGPKLYMACTQNDVTEVELLTSNSNSISWAAAAVVAAFAKAGDVVSYCFRSRGGIPARDSALWYFVEYDALDPAYRFLIESNLVDVNYEMDRTGSVLGAIAEGGTATKRHALVEYMFKEGAWPNQRVDSSGGQCALTVAAGHTDRQMVELFLDHGARIEGSGALILAAATGNEENVRCLLSRGADVNESVRLSDLKRGVPAECALHNAVEYGNIGVMEILLQAGADPTLRDGRGRTAVEIGREKGLDPEVLARMS